MTDSQALDDRQRAFVETARSATLATIARNGRPRLVPICFVVGGLEPGQSTRIYSPIDEKPKGTPDPWSLARVRDLIDRPHAAILVERWSEDWSQLGWLRLEVRGEILEPAGRDRAEHLAAVAALRTRYPQYATHRLDVRPILRFTIERAVAWGDLGAS